MPTTDRTMNVTPYAVNCSSPAACASDDGIAVAYLTLTEGQRPGEEQEEGLHMVFCQPEETSPEVVLDRDRGRYLFPPRICPVSDGVLTIHAAGRDNQWELNGTHVPYEDHQAKPVFKLREEGIRYHNLDCSSDPAGATWMIYERHQGKSVTVCARPVTEALEPGNPIQLSREGRNAYDPNIAIREDGTVLCVWTEFCDGVYRVVSRTVEKGTPGKAEVLTGDTVHSYYPTLTSAGEHDTFLTWITFDGPPLNGHPMNTYVDHDLRKHVQSFWDHTRRLHMVKREGGSWYAPDFPDGDLVSSVYNPTFATPWVTDDGAIQMVARVPELVGIQGRKFTTYSANTLSSGWGDAELIWEKTGGEDGPIIIVRHEGKPYLVTHFDDRETTRNFGYMPGESSVLVHPLEMKEEEAARPDWKPYAVKNESNTQDNQLPARVKDTMTTDEGEYTLIFGQLHRHTNISVCAREKNGSADLHYRHAIDVQGESCCATTDHGMHSDPHDWRWAMKMAAFYTRPGDFAALPAEEWTSSNMRRVWSTHGHLNLYHLDENQPCYDSNSPHERTPWQIWDKMDPRLSLSIPHHMCSEGHPYDWDAYDEDFLPVVEIFQDSRGTNEYPGAPGTTDNDHLNDPELYVHHALERGYRIGFIGGGDHCGVSLAGIYVRDISRQGVFEALRSRRCFATTGCQAAVKIWVNGARMGSEVASDPDDPREVRARIQAPTGVDRIVLVSDGEEVYTSGHKTLEWTDDEVLDASRYYYVRGELDNGELVWSSPVWINPAE